MRGVREGDGDSVEVRMDADKAEGPDTRDRVTSETVGDGKRRHEQRGI